MKIIDMMKAFFITLLFLAGLIILPFVGILLAAGFVFSLSYVIMREVRKDKARIREFEKTERAKTEGRNRVELSIVK